MTFETLGQSAIIFPKFKMSLKIPKIWKIILYRNNKDLCINNLLRFDKPFVHREWPITDGT